jgi:hypothetical protein
MGYMDLTCRKSISLMKGIKYSEYISDKLYLGYKYEIYLFFEIPPVAFCSRIKKARLILFKIPLNVIKSSSVPRSNQYSIYPLLDYFSIYSLCYAHPRADDGLRVDYKDRACISYTEIDITTIAEAWLEERLENKGLLLNSAPNARRLAYASDTYKTIGMRPTLRLTFEGITWPLSAAPCTVEVD